MEAGTAEDAHFHIRACNPVVVDAAGHNPRADPAREREQARQRGPVEDIVDTLRERLSEEEEAGPDLSGVLPVDREDVDSPQRDAEPPRVQLTRAGPQRHPQRAGRDVRDQPDDLLGKDAGGRGSRGRVEAGVGQQRGHEGNEQGRRTDDGTRSERRIHYASRVGSTRPRQGLVGNRDFVLDIHQGLERDA